MKKHAVDYLDMDNGVSNRITRHLIIILNQENVVHHQNYNIIK